MCMQFVQRECLLNVRPAVVSSVMQMSVVLNCMCAELHAGIQDSAGVGFAFAKPT